jgi:hypothetical protein
MTAEELKAKMGQGQRPKVKDFTLKTEEGEELALVLRRPPPSMAEALLKDAETLREGSSGPAVLAFQCRLVSETVYAPGAVRPLYTANEAKECAYLPELFKHAMPALAASVGQAVEEAKGN